MLMFALFPFYFILSLLYYCVMLFMKSLFLVLYFYPECLTAGREQFIKGAAKTAGEPEHFPEQPGGGAAATHHHPAGAEHSPTYTDSKTAGKYHTQRKPGNINGFGCSDI